MQDNLVNMLSIEEEFDRALSLPSSPVNREPDSLQQLTKLLGRGTRMKNQFSGKTSTSSNFTSNSEKAKEGATSTTSMLGMHSKGSRLQVMLDYRAVRQDDLSVVKGEEVEVMTVSLSRGYLVSRLETEDQQQGWIPAYVLHEVNQQVKKGTSWGFRVRKQSFTRLQQQMQQQQQQQRSSANIVQVVVGETGILLAPGTVSSSETVSWRGPRGDKLLPGGRLTLAEDGAKLILAKCQESDSGEYTCTVGARTVKLVLVVSRVPLPPLPPPQPRILNLKETSATLIWDQDPHHQGAMVGGGGERVMRLEACCLATGKWQTMQSNIRGQQTTVDNLVQGETYSFRLVCVSTDPDSKEVGGLRESEPSLPSPPLTVPLVDVPVSGDSSKGVGYLTSGGKRSSAGDKLSEKLATGGLETNFEDQYIELEEVGRGRFSVVRRCQEVKTGREVAVKFVNQRRRSRDQARQEHALLARVRHSNIVTAGGIFITATSPAIVMDLVSGCHLIEWLCEEPRYSESTVCGVIVQLLSALSYLHTSSILHLDIRPENLMLEADKRTVKLIDFGEACSVSRGGVQDKDPDLMDPEFRAPEVLESGTLGTYTDMWSLGVLVFVLLSGMSPFLDESPEQTLSNIQNCVFSFPEDCTCSNLGRELVVRLLTLDSAARLSAPSCLTSSWLRLSPANSISSRHLSYFNTRRRRLANSSRSLSQMPK